MSGIANLVTAAVLLTGSDVTDDAMRAFAEMGFRPQVVAEATLLVSGTEALFEERFGTEILVAPSGVVAFPDNDGSESTRDLPLDGLDPTFRKMIRSAGFEARIDFGPASFDQQQAAAVQEETMTVLSAAVLLRDGNDTQGVSDGFAKLGFEVQVISEGVLLLIADASVFEAGFSTSLKMDEAGARTLSDSHGIETCQLPLEALPETLREQIVEIEFEALPDFGPTSF